MLRSYIVIAFRNLMKNKVFSAINILGLGIGLAACILIFEFVSYELTYDSFNAKLDRIYRVTNDRFQNGKLIQHGTIMYPTIGPTMARDFPEIEEYTRLMPNGESIVKIDDRIFTGVQSHYADEYFFSVFSYKFLAGVRTSALKERFNIVLTETLANKYFGDQHGDYSNIVGKVIYLALDPQPYKITGVCEDMPMNSHLQFDALISYATLISPEEPDADVSWTWSDMRHYLVLRPDADPASLESKFPAYSERYFKGDKVSGSVEKFYLQPLKEAHLYSDYEYDIAKRTNGKSVWAMLIVAFFILFIAWINYINLTTSRALDRAKEVGLRKVMGAFRGQLVWQFLFESILVSVFAFIAALLFTLVFQATFNEIIGGELSLWKVFFTIDSSTIIVFSAVMMLGVLLSGFYPAFVLSGYRPVTVLKGKFQRSQGGQWMRKSLVIFQFTASAALITGTFIVSRQLNFMNEADLGINISKIMIVEAPELTAWDSTFIHRVENFKNALIQINGVSAATTSNRIPGDRLGRAFNIRLADQPSTANYTMSFQNVDYNFFDLYQIPVLAGRKFLPSDHKVEWSLLNTVMLNENGARLLGIDSIQDAVGKEIQWGGDNGQRKWTIIGVVKNFHQKSLKTPMEPMIFRPSYSTGAFTSIRIASENPQTIADVERIYKEFFPGNSFAYFFLNDRYNMQYRDDKRFGRMIVIFTGLAIIISCLGLIGLSSYTAVQRTKEIGIRKVLGASLISIVSLLSMNFIRLVLIATILALPIAYSLGQNWLQGYAYRVSVDWWIYAVPAMLIILIAMMTMSFQVLKTARTNPAETLKYE